jgi:NAD-specific glutamate dehydrogenase
VRKQVNDLLELLTDTVTYKPVIESGKKLAKQITVWEEKLVQPKAQSNDDIINFVNMLSADYIFLKGEMDVNIPAVTNGQKQRLTELNALWQPLKNEYGDIQKQVADFNALCRKLNIEKITIPEPAI